MKKLLTILLSALVMMTSFTTRVFANEITNVGDVIATNPNFPSNPEDGWTLVGDGITAITYVYNDKLYFQEKGNPTSNINVATTATLTKENDNYTVNSSDGKVTFVMKSNSLKNIMVSGSSNNALNGTYTILLYWGYDDSTKTLYLSKTASAITTKGSLDANVFDATETYTSQSVGWTGIQSDVEKVEILNEIKPSNMNSWFDKMSNLTQIIGLTNLNTESVVSMSGLFNKCEKLETIDLSNFDTSNVTSMQNMFAYCSNLTSLTFGEKFDTSKVTNMSSMFGMCSSLETLTFGSSFITTEVTNIGAMFYNCSSLETLDLSNFDFEKVTFATNMLNGATALSQIKTPKNLTKDVSLPTLTGTAAWYNGNIKYADTKLPQNSATSSTLVAGYPITVSKGITNGNVTVAVAPTTEGNYIVGSTVTLTVAPSDGYQLKANSLKATYNDGVQNQTIIPTATQIEGQYTFTMPAYTVTVAAEFENKAITIADILPNGFPTYSGGIPSNAWKNSVGSKMYINNNNGLTFGDVITYSILSEPVTKDGNNYKYILNQYTITFVMDSNKLVKVITEGSWNADDNGEYIPSHTHSFTYTVNNGKLTATCTDGCSDGYDDNPLTLTLTPPTSLVYDGNAKAFTFADGEADAWTSAGLGLPTIAYVAKSGSTLTNDKAVDAGSYTASITVDTNKTASLDFEITKATPYIKNKPEPSDIVFGKKLSDSTLAGGYVQVSETNTTQIVGLFEWTNPNTIPALADSDTTLYDVTFTPIDENNYNTASCKVTITVNHTHNPILVNGQAPTESASGWKDYYECVCGDLFEDVNGTTPINNLEAWKKNGGNGYIAPLTHTITPVDGKNPTETEAGYKPYYECKNCGKYYEDVAGVIVISNINTWKAEGGNGYIAPLTPTPDYEIISGNNANINIDDNKDALFTSDAEYSKFDRVEVDGVTVNSSNYSVVEGSTKVTLKASYLSTLSVGQHTIDIISTDGHASTTFTITKASNPSPNPGYDVPNTGVDGMHANDCLLFTLSFISLLAIVVLVMIKRRTTNR